MKAGNLDTLADDHIFVEELLDAYRNERTAHKVMFHGVAEETNIVFVLIGFQ